MQVKGFHTSILQICKFLVHGKNLVQWLMGLKFIIRMKLILHFTTSLASNDHKIAATQLRISLIKTFILLFLKLVKRSKN